MRYIPNYYQFKLIENRWIYLGKVSNAEWGYGHYRGVRTLHFDMKMPNMIKRVNI